MVGISWVCVGSLWYLPGSGGSSNASPGPQVHMVRVVEGQMFVGVPRLTELHWRREGHLSLQSESEALITYCWLVCQKTGDHYELRGIVLPLTPQYSMRWSFAKRHTFSSDPQFHLRPLDAAVESVPLHLSLRDENTDCPYHISGHISEEAFSSNTGWTLTASTAHTAHIIDLPSLCSDVADGYEDPVLFHDIEMWGNGTAAWLPAALEKGVAGSNSSQNKVTIVMNPVHPFANAAAADLQIQIMLYHIQHHLCLGVDDYLMYIEPAQARYFLGSEGIRGLIRQNRLHIIIWDHPVIRPRKRKKDAFGSPTPAGIHFWQPAQYNHALLLFWGKSRYLFFIDIDEFLSGPISHILDLNTNSRHILLVEQIQMYCLECGPDQEPESKLWVEHGPSHMLSKYVGKGGYAKLVTTDFAEPPAVVPKRHIKSLVHTDDSLVMHNHMPFISPNNTKDVIFTVATDQIFLAHFLNLWRFRSNQRFLNDEYPMVNSTFDFCGISYSPIPMPYWHTSIMSVPHKSH